MSSAALSLWRLLDDMDAAGIKLPRGTTGEVRMDAKCAAWVARKLDLPADFVWALFSGRPVRECRAIVAWAQRDSDPMEQIKRLASWGRKRGQVVPDRLVRGAVAAVRGQQQARGRGGAWGEQDEAERERIASRFGGAA